MEPVHAVQTAAVVLAVNSQLPGNLVSALKAILLFKIPGKVSITANLNPDPVDHRRRFVGAHRECSCENIKSLFERKTVCLL